MDPVGQAGRVVAPGAVALAALRVADPTMMSRRCGLVGLEVIRGWKVISGVTCTGSWEPVQPLYGDHYVWRA